MSGTRESEILTSLISVLKNQYPDKIAELDTGNLAPPLDPGNIFVNDFGEAPKNKKVFVLVGSTVEFLDQVAQDVFGNLTLYVGVFWGWSTGTDGRLFRQGSIYRTALASVVSVNYNRIIGNKKFEIGGINSTPIEDFENNRYMTTGVTVSARINVTRKP